MAKKTIFCEFIKFTNLYEFSKTLQFSLMPLKWDKNEKQVVEEREFGENIARSILKETVESDEQIAKNTNAAKFYLDILHREFINDALGKLKFKVEDLESVYSILGKIEKTKKDKEKLKDLRRQLSITKEKILENIKNILIGENEEKNILLTEGCLGILRKRFTKEEVNKLRKESKNQEIVYPDVIYLNERGEEKSVFEMKAGYLDEFHKNRELLYSIRNKKGSLARRIIENFVDIFCKNMRVFEEKYKNSEVDFSLVERDFGIKIKKFFELEYYNACISQTGIDEYNKILGGESRKQEKKANIEGLNQIINICRQKKESEYKERQRKKGEKKTKFNKKDYPFFVPLQKQILSQVFRKEILIENDNDLIRKLEFFIEKSQKKIEKAREIINSFYEYEKNGFDLTKIHLPKNKINSVAYKVFKEPQDFLSIFRDGKSNLDAINFAKVVTYLNENQLEYKNFFKTLIRDRKGFDAFLCIWKHEFDILIEGGEMVVKGGEKEKVESIITKQKELEKWLKWFEDKVRKREKMTDEDESLWCSAVLAYSQTVLDVTKRAEMFWLNNKQTIKISEDDKDPKFYQLFNKFVEDDFIPFFYFDKFRNYLNKRSRNTSRGIKLYFDNEHLLDGWDLSKENAYCGFLFRKDNNYYLGIGRKNASLFHDSEGKKIDNAYKANATDFYEKIEYKQLDIGKFEGIAFPKKTKSEENYEKALRDRSDEFFKGNIEKLKKLLSIKKEYDEFKEKRYKDKAWERKFDADKERELIDYYITCLQTREEWKCFKFEFKDPKDYQGRDDFVAHIQRQAYWIELKKVSKDYVDEKVKEGKLFLFRIHTKDFYDFKVKLSDNNPYRQDRKPSKVNLFTQFFLELFSQENIENIENKDLSKSIFELDGKAEIRYRYATDKVKQKAYKKDGKVVTRIDKRSGDNGKEVLQHRRFTRNALTLHLKTRLNFGKYIDFREFNKLVNKELFTQTPVRVLGMDRGENNLIFYCVLSEKGEIEKCGSLNKIGSQIRKLADGTTITEPVDYCKLLVEREKRRDWERKNWQKVTSIKDLKDGYLGNVKNWVVKEILDNLDSGYATLNALEDLSGSFKRTRFFRERQVYQNFEKELIEKLKYVVDKNRGNYRNAYQFTPFISSVDEMEKNRQVGTLVYVPAGFTSKICPRCGWRKRLNIKNSETKEKIAGTKMQKGFLENSIAISYGKEKDRFCFEYEWEQEYTDDGVVKKYTGDDKVCSNVSRTRWDDQNKKTIEFKDGTDESITNQLKRLFRDNRIDIEKNINRQIIERREELSLEFFRSIIFYLNLIMQIRNYDREKEGNMADCIECPAEKDGKLCRFDSRNPAQNGKLKEIKNGDANGAYNIARKGLMLLARIKTNPDNPSLFVNNKDYDEAVNDWDAFIRQWNPTSKSQK